MVKNVVNGKVDELAYMQDNALSDTQIFATEGADGVIKSVKDGKPIPPPPKSAQSGRAVDPKSGKPVPVGAYNAGEHWVTPDGRLWADGKYYIEVNKNKLNKLAEDEHDAPESSSWDANARYYVLLDGRLWKAGSYYYHSARRLGRIEKITNERSSAPGSVNEPGTIFTDGSNIALGVEIQGKYQEVALDPEGRLYADGKYYTRNGATKKIALATNQDTPNAGKGGVPHQPGAKATVKGPEVPTAPEGPAPPEGPGAPSEPGQAPTHPGSRPKPGVPRPVAPPVVEA